MTAEKPLVIKDKRLLCPIIQGGMAVRISLEDLAVAVANAGGIGTIALSGLKPDEAGWRIREAKRRLDKDYPGFLAVNIMAVLQDFKKLLEVAIREGVDIVISGAGFSMDAFGICQEAGVAYFPIVSSDRLAKIAEKRGATAIVAESGDAGGHLGTDKSLSEILPEIVKAVDIPVFAAGGIMHREDVEVVLEIGAIGVQVGSRFAVSVESSAHDNWKQAVINATEDDLTIVTTPAGMPLRALKSQYTEAIESGASFEDISREFRDETCDSCLRKCKKDKHCILHALIRAQQGDVITGVVTIGARVGEVTKIQSAREIIDEFMPTTT